ncbi:MAG: lysylphosphatidylglycerol synthase domain-containing protein [Ilumatobacter sp.]|nr:lysylphosphatidylglycerol synthase domain-containing protein [Ilumatobacter sp.]
MGGDHEDKSSATVAAEGLPADLTPNSRRNTIRRIAFRVALVVAVLGFSTWVLFNVFDDLNWDEVRRSIAELSDAEALSLIFGWMVWVVTQGALTASLVDKLAVRRGVLASLGPTAISSLIPGPSDLPIRFRMYQSWGVSSSEATTAVVGSGVFSIGANLILPSIAGVLIVLADVPLSGFFSVIVTASVALAIIVAAAGFTLGSQQRTLTVGRWLDRPTRAVTNKLRKTLPDDNLGVFFVKKRAEAVDQLSGKWLKCSLATIATTAAKCSLLVLTLRFVGIPEDNLGWLAVAAAYGLVAGMTAIPITPGSAGVAELGFVGLLTAAADGDWVNQITAGVLLYRLMTWLLLIPVGMGALGVWRYGVRAAERRSAEINAV